MVGTNNEIDTELYYQLYLHRLLPLLWHANDFYAGARATDDGIKSAATRSMTAMTGFKGRYDHATSNYKPLPPYRTWSEVAQNNGLRLEAGDHLWIMPSLGNDALS